MFSGTSHSATLRSSVTSSNRLTSSSKLTLDSEEEAAIRLQLPPDATNVCNLNESSDNGFAAEDSGGVAGVSNKSCPYCGKSFLRLWHLQRHLRSHTGERPFPCSLCSYRATHRSNLQRHMGSVHWKKGDTVPDE